VAGAWAAALRCPQAWAAGDVLWGVLAVAPETDKKGTLKAKARMSGFIRRISDLE
jgi:hypothetical protein